MRLLNCVGCGRLFQANNSDFCPNCRDAAEADLRLVRDYLEDHPNASVTEVCKGTGVSVDRITHLMRQGYVTATQGTAAAITCRSCGTEIPHGRFCQRCVERLQTEISDVVQEKKADQRTIHTWRERDR